MAHAGSAMDTDVAQHPPSELPRLENAIVRSLRLKLERNNQIRRFSDFDKLGELGTGTFGQVFKVRKKASGQVFAVKLWNDAGNAAPNLTHLSVLSELAALLKVNDGWHACDELDRAWCPLVQLHGLFLRPRGLLMEMYGESLYDLLRNDDKRGRFYADGPAPTFRSHVSVASNVASACRYLHDIGMDANVLAARTPDGRWHAKLTDWGNSAMVRTVLQGLRVGTLHAMAPEMLHPFGETGLEDARLDARAVDVYAFGILLCALWDRGRFPLRHIPPAERAAVEHLRHLGQQDRDLILLRRLMCIDECFMPETKPEGLRPPPPEDMPDFFKEMMRSCLRRKPEDRPTFLKICEDIKKEYRRAPAANEGPRADLRVIAVVRYNPKHATRGKLHFHVSVTVEDRSTPLTLHPSGYVDTAGDAAFAFPFAACSGERVTLSIGNDPDAPNRPPHTVDFDWVGHDARDLPLPAVGAPPESVEAELIPDWGASPPIPREGSRVALQLNIHRHAPSGGVKTRSLGVVSVLMAPNTLHRSETPKQFPRALRSRFAVEYDVMLSYRDAETGTSGSNFAFRLQEALELKNLVVFCYANLVQSDHWMSPLTNGVAACRVFMPILSPEYGDLDKAPWGAAELMHAAARLQAPGGPAAILPVWHSGAYPPNGDTANLLHNRPYVPDRELYGNTPARDMRYKHVWLVVHDALKHLLD